MNKLLILCGLFLLSASCARENVPVYSGNNYVQFKQVEPIKFSFVTAGSSVKRDTLWIEAFCSGSTSKEVRHFRIRQVPEYVFSYDYDDKGKLVDSALVIKGNQAMAGVHYVAFDDPGYQRLCTISKDSVNFRVPVILLRDYSLKTVEKSFLLAFEGSGDLESGDSQTNVQKIIVSDMLFYPEAWSNYSPRPEFWGRSQFFGQYGKVKHQLMIDVTGKPWDNAFIDQLSYEQKMYYKNIVAAELEKINKAREAKGEGPLMEDPDNPNSVITFP